MTAISSYIDSIARRVRDASNTGHTRAFVRDIFTRCSSVINYQQEYVYDTVTLTNGTANTALYRLEADIGIVSSIGDVEVGGDSLELVDPWRDLWKLSSTWLTDRASVPLAYAPIGRDLVALWPAPMVDIAITFTGVRGNFQAAAETEDNGLRDEDNDLIRELTTAILLFRQRDLDSIQGVITRLTGKLNVQRIETDMLMRLG